MVAAALAILSAAANPGGIAGADVLDAVLGVWESKLEPEDRRRRYLEIREQFRAPS